MNPAAISSRRWSADWTPSFLTSHGQVSLASCNVARAHRRTRHRSEEPNVAGSTETSHHLVLNHRLILSHRLSDRSSPPLESSYQRLIIVSACIIVSTGHTASCNDTVPVSIHHWQDTGTQLRGSWGWARCLRERPPPTAN